MTAYLCRVFVFMLKCLDLIVCCQGARFHRKTEISSHA
jgi:hypothetical protein